MSDVPSTLVADLYDAAVEEDGLEHIAESLGRFAGVEGAALILVRADEPPEAYSSPAIREQSHLYQAYYHRLDPWRPRGFVPGRDRLVLANELYPESELIRTEFYADFARPMGMFRPMSGYFDLGGGEMAAFGVEQPFGARLFEAEDKARLAALMPFLKRALLARSRVKAARRGTEVGFQALDALAIAVVVCDSGGRIVHANRAAAGLAGEGIRVGGVGEVLQAGTADETRRLEALIRTAGDGAAGTMRLGSADGRFVAVLAAPVPAPVPMPDGAGPGRATGHVMITLRLERGVPSPNVGVLRSLYGLSPAQGRLCLSLAAGATFEAAALEHDVAVTTMRTHLAAILERTGTRNLRDLLRLLGAISPGI